MSLEAFLPREPRFYADETSGLMKACDNAGPIRFSRGQVDDAGNDLTVVGDDCGLASVVINAAKEKGVRLNKADFVGKDVVHVNENVMILRGDACKLLDCFFEGAEGALAGGESRIGERADDLVEVLGDHPQSLNACNQADKTNAGLFGDYEEEDVFDPCEVEPWQDGRVWISEADLCDETNNPRSV